LYVVSLKLSNTHPRIEDLYFAALYDYAGLPRKTKWFDGDSARMLGMALGNSYLSLSVGGNDFSETLFRVGLGGGK
jgi:hypothetical protein